MQKAGSRTQFLLLENQAENQAETKGGTKTAAIVRAGIWHAMWLWRSMMSLFVPEACPTALDMASTAACLAGADQARSIARNCILYRGKPNMLTCTSTASSNSDRGWLSVSMMWAAVASSLHLQQHAKHVPAPNPTVSIETAVSAGPECSWLATMYFKNKRQQHPF